MTERFRNKYRSPSARLTGYDYTRNGAYFVTICTNKHICYFGDIIVETGLRPVSTKINSLYYPINSYCVKLSAEGKIVSDCWYDLPDHYSNIILDEFIVMPNHIHGIIIIQNNSCKNQIHGLSEFVRAFKSFSSRRIKELHQSNISDTWQPRFYDHIIRCENELDRIRIYIKNNPDNWLNDKYCIIPKDL